MSKRKSVGASNTLFNYFSSVNSKAKQAKDTSANASDLDSSLVDEENSKTKSNKRERQNTPPCEANSDSNDSTPISGKKRKRIRLRPIDSDDSDVENKVDNTLESEKKTVSEKLNESFKFEANQTPRAKKPVDSTNNIDPPKAVVVEKNADNDDGNWVHCKLEWLKPHKIRDVHKRRPDDPNYDPTTLFVPQQFLDKQTPGHKQWWEMKSLHYDCVLFFKVGKFYELYHMDAAVGVKELGFSYMKGEFAHSGFPESAYARMVSTLVAKGYKVARVEQTETPEMMKERCKNSRQKVCDKVVRREICQVTVKGVQVCGLQDPGPADAAAQYMMTVVEEERLGYSVYGVCFLDTSIGLFHLGQFKDDKHSSRLLTTFAHYPPALIVYDRKCTSGRTLRLINSHAPGARKEALSVWAPDKTLKILAEKYYRTDANGDWPEGLKPYLHEGDALGLTPAANCSLAIKALGGCVAYLTECLLDIQVLGMSQFSTYEPPDALNKTLSQEDKVENSQEIWKGSNSMVLDAITLRNLRIVQDEGCLYDKLNSCSTAMGKRLLYQWVCAPSCNLKVIEQRQEAVKELFNNQELCQDAKKVLTTLPDLERLLAKVHGLGNSMKSKVHPDSRAILYEEKIYSKRKVLDFISVLNGFTAALELVELFAKTEPKMLKLITQYAPEGKFPDYRSTLKFFKEGFDQTEAQKEGRILPGVGVDPQYDNALQVIDDIEREAKQYLAEQEKYFRCRLTYVGTNKKRYQIEVPQSAVSKAGGDYKLEGARKGFKRFSTDESRDILARMLAAEDQKINVLKDLSRRIFEKFSSHYKQWETAVQCIATLDIFLSMAEFARQQTNDVCLPEITFSNKNKPYINIVDGRHPCIPVANEFIPNDTVLGQVSKDGNMSKTGTLLLLTGPNMGGKSTLMRQVGLLSVLAHLGSYVPAAECSMSLVDRIFTRVGASDDILSGQSTFLVEMNETAAIVNHATVHSLVLLDELGRGTSTYDGTAIASGVCAELATRGCRVVFSTHYHSVVHHLAAHPNVVLGHMACMVETDETSADGDEIPDETITFLYKLSPGACPKSYGFNAARLAGIPKDITTRAHQISKDLEKEATCVRAFRDIFKKERSNAGNVRELLAGLCI